MTTIERNRIKNANLKKKSSETENYLNAKRTLKDKAKKNGYSVGFIPDSYMFDNLGNGKLTADFHSGPVMFLMNEDFIFSLTSVATNKARIEDINGNGVSLYDVTGSGTVSKIFSGLKRHEPDSLFNILTEKYSKFSLHVAFRDKLIVHYPIYEYSNVTDIFLNFERLTFAFNKKKLENIKDFFAAIDHAEKTARERGYDLNFGIDFTDIFDSLGNTYYDSLWHGGYVMSLFNSETGFGFSLEAVGDVEATLFGEEDQELSYVKDRSNLGNFRPEMDRYIHGDWELSLILENRHPNHPEYNLFFENNNWYEVFIEKMNPKNGQMETIFSDVLDGTLLDILETIGDTIDWIELFAGSL